MTVVDEPSAPPRALGRGRLAALGAVALLAVGAAALGLRGDDPATPVPTEDLVEVERLQAAAALDPCPAGLGPEVPALVLPCLGGGDAVALDAAPPGRPTLVNVWATWCGPCVDEVPALAEFHERAGERVGLVGVLTSDTRRSALTFARQFAMRWPSVVDDDGVVLRAFGSGPPITLFLDADGRVAHVERGAVDSADEVAALVAEHLGVVL